MRSRNRHGGHKRLTRRRMVWLLFLAALAMTAVVPFLQSVPLPTPSQMNSKGILEGFQMGEGNNHGDAVNKRGDADALKDMHAASTKSQDSVDQQPTPRVWNMTIKQHDPQMLEKVRQRCALCFFGLPRSFGSMVLPSIRKNILIPNKEYQCDIFVHFFSVDQEPGGRSGAGGEINSTEIYELKDSVQQLYKEDVAAGRSPRVLVSFVNNTDGEFWRQRGDIIHKYETTMDAEGNPVYFPYKARTYTFPTTLHNILRQWHSIDSVWKHMERMGHRLGKSYDRVAMLRSDVIYVTPLDIFEVERDVYDYENQHVIVPHFAQYPVNDRMIYGPHDAVRTWATQRFPRVEMHAKTFANKGYIMHSEQFLNHSIFTPMQQEQHYEVKTNPDICFFRARAGNMVWISDCVTRGGSTRDFRNKAKLRLVEDILGRSCVKSKLRHRVTQAHCPLESIDNIGSHGNGTAVGGDGGDNVQKDADAQLHDEHEE